MQVSFFPCKNANLQCSHPVSMIGALSSRGDASRESRNTLTKDARTDGKSRTSRTPEPARCQGDKRQAGTEPSKTKNLRDAGKVEASSKDSYSDFDRELCLANLTNSLVNIKSLDTELRSHKYVSDIFGDCILDTEKFMLLDGNPELAQKQLLKSLMDNEACLGDCVAKCAQDLRIMESSDDDEVADKLTELANSIADMENELHEPMLTDLLRKSVTVFRWVVKAQMINREAMDFCPVAEGWFCLLVVVWSKLRDLVTTPADEAEKLCACLHQF